MSLTVHIRVFVPGEHTRPDAVGHYDLIVEGTHCFHGKVLTNPVFSYRTTGHLQVFEESESGNYYDTSSNGFYYDCSIYKWTFILPNDNYSMLVSSFESAIDSYGSLDNSENGCECVLKDSNPFYIYSVQNYNCFHAVAVWLYTLGNFTAYAIYTGTHDNAYKKYSAFNMASEYLGHPAWSRYYPQ